MISATIQELLRRTANAFQLPAEPGTDARDPLSAVCFGGGAAALAARLRYFWPDAGEKIKCVNLDPANEPDADGIFPLFTFTPENGNINGNPSDLSNAGYTRLVWFLDASGIRDPKELGVWLDIKSRQRENAREKFQSGVEIAELMILLTDDASAVFGGKTADKLRGELIRRGKENNCPMILLSTRRESSRYNHIINGDYVRRGDARDTGDASLSGDPPRVASLYDAAAAFLAVWNAPDAPELEPGFYTLGYARAERPVEQISRLCVLALLGELSREEPGPDISRDRDALRNRLGLENDGVLPFLESYLADAVNRFAPFRPELFPRADQSAGNGVPENLTAKEFNELTFGTWNAWLAESIGAARERLRHDLPGAKRWREEFADMLRINLTIRERALLAANAEKTVKLLLSGKIPSGDMPLKSYAEAWLQSLLSSARELNASLADVIRWEGEPARMFLSLWQDLLRAAPPPPVPDSRGGFGLDSYQEALQAYFTRHGSALRRQLWHMDRDQKISKEDLSKGDAGLRAFLEQALDGLLSDETLHLAAGADLAGEWEFRMKAEPDAAMSGLARTLCEIPPRLSAATGEPFAVTLLAGPDEPLRDFLEYALRASINAGTNANANINANANNANINANINPAPEDTPDEIAGETENPLPDIKTNQTIKADARGIFGFYNTGRRGTAETLALYRADREK